MGSFSENARSGIVYDDVIITLGTLAGKATITTNSKIDSGRKQGFRLLKTQFGIEVRGKSAAEGPIIVGLAVGLSVTEISQAMAADPQRSGDPDQEEEAHRAVFPFMRIPSGVTATIDDGVGGLLMEKNMRWSIVEGDSLQWYAWNQDDNVLTTGGVIRIFAKHWGVWLKD